MNRSIGQDQQPLTQQVEPQLKPLITIKGVRKSYRVKRQTIAALTNVNLDIYPGEFVAIVGESGSGKSTLLQLIGGLDRPTTGQVIVNQQNLAKLSNRRLTIFRNRTVGFIFQSFYLQPFLSLLSNIEVAGMPNRTKRQLRRNRAIQLAKQVHLGDRLDHSPSELSGGQIQRVAIARALLNNPSIVLADEPTGNLDTTTGQEVINLLRSFQRQQRTTLVIVTHSQVVASQADRVIRISDGAIAANASAVARP